MGTQGRWRSLSIMVAGALFWTTLAVGQARLVLSVAPSGEALAATVSPAPQVCQSIPIVRVLRKARLGDARLVWPAAIAADAQTSRVFVATQPYSVSVLDSQAGDLLRSVNMGSGIPEPFALAADEATGHIFVADNGADTVNTLDARSGTVLRVETVPHQPMVLTIDDRTHHAFVASFRSAIVSMLDTRTGAALPVSPTVGGPYILAVDTRAGYVFVSDGSGTVYMLDAATGAYVQSTLFADYADVHEMAVDEQTGRLFATGTGDTVHLLDTHSGAVLRVVKVGANPYNLAVSVTTGRVFVANNNDSTVSVLDAATGAVLHTVDIGATPQYLAVDEHTGRVFVSTDAGGVAVLDASSGALLQTVDVGHQPQALAVDERAGRVFVLDPRQATVTTLAEAPPLPARSPVSPAPAHGGGTLLRAHLPYPEWSLPQLLEPLRRRGYLRLSAHRAVQRGRPPGAIHRPL